MVFYLFKSMLFLEARGELSALHAVSMLMNRQQKIAMQVQNTVGKCCLGNGKLRYFVHISQCKNLQGGVHVRPRPIKTLLSVCFFCLFVFCTGGILKPIKSKLLSK